MTLRRSIVLLIVGLLAGTALLIGSVAFFTTRASIARLLDRQLTQANESVRNRLESYFGQAGPALVFGHTLLRFHPNLIHDWEEPGLDLALFLDAQQEVAWIYIAEV